MKTLNKNKKGYIALISVLIVGAAGIAVTLSLLFLGTGANRTSFAFEQANQAKALANSCVEEALQQIRDSTLFVGNDNLAFDQGICAYTVVSQGSENRTIEAWGTVGTTIRRVKVVVQGINPLVEVVSWLEVSDF